MSTYLISLTSLGPGLRRNFYIEIHIRKPKIFKPGIWVAGSTAASQPEAMFRNTCSLTWILRSNPGHWLVRRSTNKTSVPHRGIHYRHCSDVITGAIAFQITSLTHVYSTVYSDADKRKHQSSASLAFVRGIHRGPVNSPHKWPVTRKMFPFDDVITRKGCQEIS